MAAAPRRSMNPRWLESDIATEPSDAPAEPVKRLAGAARLAAQTERMVRFVRGRDETPPAHGHVEALERFLAEPGVAAAVTARRVLPARPAVHGAAARTGSTRASSRALEQRGITALYRHQAEASRRCATARTWPS